MFLVSMPEVRSYILTMAGQYPSLHLIIARHYVEEPNLREVLQVYEWLKTVTYDGEYEFESIELIGRIRTCGGVFGQFFRYKKVYCNGRLKTESQFPFQDPFWLNQAYMHSGTRKTRSYACKDFIPLK